MQTGLQPHQGLVQQPALPNCTSRYASVTDAWCQSNCHGFGGQLHSACSHSSSDERRACECRNAKATTTTPVATGCTLCLGAPEMAWRFNVFALNQIGTPQAPYQSLIGGQCAVGTNVWFKGVSANAERRNADVGGDRDLVVLYAGGQVHMQGGEIFAGDVEAGGSVVLDCATVHGSISSGGDLLTSVQHCHGSVDGVANLSGIHHGGVWVDGRGVREGVPFSASLDFAQLAGYFRDHSALLARMPRTPTPTPVYGQIILHVEAGVNVLSLSASALREAWYIGISGPAAAEVVINVFDTEVILSGKVWAFEGGVSPVHTLVNLPHARNMILSGGGHTFTLLAPETDVTFRGGVMTGHMVAKNLYGNGQVQAPSQKRCGTCEPACEVDSGCMERGTMRTLPSLPQQLWTRGRLRSEA